MTEPRTGNLPLGRPNLPRQVWTADRFGRLLAGGSIFLCLTAAWALRSSDGPDALALALLAALIGLEQVVTALIGWCPFHQMMKRMGIKDREEVFVELFGASGIRGSRQVLSLVKTEKAPEQTALKG
jgi:hypothetical protein